MACRANELPGRRRTGAGGPEGHSSMGPAKPGLSPPASDPKRLVTGRRQQAAGRREGWNARPSAVQTRGCRIAPFQLQERAPPAALRGLQGPPICPRACPRCPPGKPTPPSPSRGCRAHSSDLPPRSRAPAPEPGQRRVALEGLAEGGPERPHVAARPGLPRPGTARVFRLEQAGHGRAGRPPRPPARPGNRRAATIPAFAAAGGRPSRHQMA